MSKFWKWFLPVVVILFSVVVVASALYNTENTESSVEVPVEVEVTRVVEMPVEVEVTRVVEVEPAVMLVPTETPAPTPSPTATGVLTAMATMTETTVITPSETVEVGEWEIQWYPGATDQMRGLGSIPWSEFPQLNPAMWPEFPNVDNKNADFLASQGVEYGEDESQHCGVDDDSCSLVVAAGHYALVTGFYSIEGIGECHNPDDEGCAAVFFNVGNESVELTGIFDNVFTVQGRYWNGDYIPEASVAVISHGVGNMANLESTLNPGGTNAGSNCSVVEGCDEVNAQIFVLSGSEVLIHLEQDWARPD